MRRSPKLRVRQLAISKQDDQLQQSISNLATHGILAVRMKRRGEIAQVKHVTYGWLTAKQYSQLQILKDAQPYFIEIVRGGYQLKAWIWGASFEIGEEALATGTTFTIPAGLIVVAVAEALFWDDLGSGNQALALLDILSLVLPFGEIWLLYHGGKLFYNWITGSTKEGDASVPNWLNLALIAGPLGPGALYGLAELQKLSKEGHGDWNSVKQKFWAWASSL